MSIGQPRSGRRSDGGRGNGGGPSTVRQYSDSLTIVPRQSRVRRRDEGRKKETSGPPLSELLKNNIKLEFK